MSTSVQRKYNVKILGNQQAARTLVFGHGFGTDQSVFLPLLYHFEKDFRIVLYDNMGSAYTNADYYDPVRYNSLYAYVTDLIEILDGLQLKEVIFVGHSVSGMIGLLASIKRPDLFERLIVLAANACYLNDQVAGYKGGFDQQSLDDLFAMMKNNYHAWASGFAALAMSNPDHPQLADKFAGWLSALRPDIALMVAKVIFQSDYRDQLEKVNKPVLVIQSNDDIAVPVEAARFLHEHIRGSCFLLINATGHLPHVSASDEVVQAIKSFI